MSCFLDQLYKFVPILALMGAINLSSRFLTINVYHDPLGLRPCEWQEMYAATPCCLWQLPWSFWGASWHLAGGDLLFRVALR